MTDPTGKFARMEWIGIMVFILTALTAFAGTSEVKLDLRFFPAFAPDGSTPPGIIQANWPTDATDAGKTADLPARLFGSTTLESFELIFDCHGNVTVNGKGGEEEQPAPNQVIKFKANVDATSKTWWWEGFIMAEASHAVSVKVRADPNDADHDIDLGVFMPGDAWLMAGSPRVGEKVTITGLGTTFTDPVEGGPGRIEKPSPSASSPAPSELQPALAAYFASCLQDALPDRPLVVYVWPRGQTTLRAWQEEGGKPFGMPWNYQHDGEERALLPMTAQSPVPGFRGVIWAHGEWEAEKGDFSPPKSGGAVADAFTLDVENFGRRYARESAQFADLVRNELARSPGDLVPRERTAKKMLWVILEAPAVARQPSFLKQFLQDFEDMNAPVLSSWAALRAAQHEAVQMLRDVAHTELAPNEVIGPRAFLVPLIGDVSLPKDDTQLTLRDPGWLWKGELHSRQAGHLLADHSARFRQAGQYLADQVSARLANQPAEPQSDATFFRDGTPVVNWQADPPTLELPGVAALSGDGASRQFEVLLGSSWNDFQVSSTTTFPLSLGAGAKGVRYEWRDAPGLLRVMQFKTGETPPPWPLKPLPLTPFILLKP